MLARKTVASGALKRKLNEKLKASQVQDSDSNSDSESYKCSSKGEGPRSSDFEKSQKSPSKVSSTLSENLETRFVLVGPIRDVELPELRRSGGKKKSEQEKEREGACGEERGNGKRVVDHSPSAGLAVPAICGVEQEIVEESGKKSGGSGFGEAVEGLVNLSSQRDEPGSSVEETLADLLKKVGASYDPKKRRTNTSKVPSAPKPSKKRKASSPTPTDTSFPKGRATRSRVKQSEADLQKALAESKKKRMDKGKGKVAESSEAIEFEEMEQVHQEKVITEEVQTPKPKKPKTSSKKSSSVSAVAEPSLAHRTRSAVKSKQVRISEDEEWSGEEQEDEPDGDQDRLAMFGKRKILKGRLLKDLVEPGMIRLVDALAAQGWKDMVLQMDGRLARNEIIEFMANAEVKDGKVSSLVKGVQVTFDAEKLGEILGIPSEGFDDYTRQMWPCLDSLPTALDIIRRFCDAEDVNEARAMQKSEMRPQHKVIFEFVNKCLLPRQERRHIANYMDLALTECLERGMQINWPALIIKLLDRVINGSKAHATPYSFILTTILDRYNVSLKKWEISSSKDHFGINTLIAYDYLVSAIPNEPGSSKKTPINRKVRALVQECEAKDAEIARLKARVTELESERDALRTELTKEKEKNDGILHNMLNLLQAENQPSSSPKP